MLNNINGMKMERRLLLNNIISTLGDSSAVYKKDIISLLEKEKTFDADMELASIYIADGEYGTAHGIINASEAENSEDEDLRSYAKFLIELAERETDFYGLDSSDLAYLRELALLCPSGLASANAQSVLAFYYNEYYEECDEEKSSAATWKDIVLPDVKEVKSWLGDNYPDPFTEETAIEYYVPIGAAGEITVSDMFGRKIASLPVPEGENIIKVNASGWSPGIYIYGLTVNGKTVDYKKMVIME